MEPSDGDALGLEKQVQELQDQISEMQAKSQAVWKLLALIGSRLQLSSTSIKMAVSSLLEYEIFWDPSTSHEFLEVIDTSTDRTSDLVVLLTLAFRSQAKILEISSEPQGIQEILDALQSRISRRAAGVEIVVDYPPEGKDVLVDYQYLVVALSLLAEVAISESENLQDLTFKVVENPDNWQLQITGLDTQLMSVIAHFFRHPNDFESFVNQLVPENVLKLMVACRILYLQEITLIDGSSGQSNTLYLSIPSADSSS